MKASNAIYQEFRARFRAMERNPEWGPQEADQLAAHVAQAVSQVLKRMAPSDVSDIRRKRASKAPYAPVRYAPGREECPADAPTGHSEGAAGGGWTWTR